MIYNCFHTLSHAFTRFHTIFPASSASIQVRENASSALMNLASFRDGLDSMVATEGTVQRMVTHLMDDKHMGGEDKGEGEHTNYPGEHDGVDPPSDVVMYHLVSALACIAKHDQGVIQVHSTKCVLLLHLISSYSFNAFMRTVVSH